MCEQDKIIKRALSVLSRELLLKNPVTLLILYEKYEKILKLNKRRKIRFIIQLSVFKDSSKKQYHPPIELY